MYIGAKLGPLKCLVEKNKNKQNCRYDGIEFKGSKTRKNGHQRYWSSTKLHYKCSVCVLLYFVENYICIRKLRFYY